MPSNYVLAPCYATFIWHAPTRKLKGEPCCRNILLYKYLSHCVQPKLVHALNVTMNIH